MISALAFGLGHANLNQFFYTTVLGLLYGFIIVRTGKIQYTIVLHMVTNAWGMLIDPLSAVSETLSGIYAVLVMVCRKTFPTLKRDIRRRWRPPKKSAKVRFRRSWRI